MHFVQRAYKPHCHQTSQESIFTFSVFDRYEQTREEPYVPYRLFWADNNSSLVLDDRDDRLIQIKPTITLIVIAFPYFLLGAFCLIH